MEVDKKHIDYIQTSFVKMKDKEDFLFLLNYAKFVLYGEDVNPFLISAFDYYANPNNSKKKKN